MSAAPGTNMAEKEQPFQVVTTSVELWAGPILRMTHCCPFLEIHTILIIKASKSYFISTHFEGRHKVERRVTYS